MIAQIVYVLCSLTSILCAGLLYRRSRANRSPLLFWSTWCFICLALTNVLLFLDFVIFPQINLSHARSLLTLAAMTMLIYGLIRERY